MTPLHKLAIVGFAPAEALGLITYFRITLGVAQGYQLVAQPRLADLVLVDGANTPVLMELKGMRLSCQMLLLGASDEFPNLPFEPRPLDRERIRKAVDYLLGRHEPAAAAAPRTGWAATQPAGKARAKAPAPAPAFYAATQPMGLEALEAMESASQTYGATQPMGLMPELGAAAAPAPAWVQEDEITEEEMEAFRIARGQPAAPVAAPPAAEPEGLAEALRTAEPPVLDAPVGQSPPLVPGFELSDAGDSFVGLAGRAAPAPAARGEQPMVLLVDDKAFDGLKFERTLAQLGYGLVQVRHEREAFQAIADGDFHFIFVDMQASGGYGTARALRQRTKGASQVPTLVALSRVGGALERIRARLAGCDTTMTKPVQAQDFARQVQLRQVQLASRELQAKAR